MIPHFGSVLLAGNSGLSKVPGPHAGRSSLWQPAESSAAGVSRARAALAMWSCVLCASHIVGLQPFHSLFSMLAQAFLRRELSMTFLQPLMGR